MNDYQIFLKIRIERAEAERYRRNQQLVQEATRIEKAQPQRLRFHLRIHLPRLGSFHFRRQRQNCTPLSAR